MDGRVDRVEGERGCSIGGSVGSGDWEVSGKRLVWSFQFRVWSLRWGSHDEFGFV